MEGDFTKSFDEYQNSFTSAQEIDLRWENLNVFVPQKDQVKEKKKPSKTQPINESAPLLSADQSSSRAAQDSNKKQILFNSSGYAAHGETLAIMGPSGAGKTTLLSILSQRWTEGKNHVVQGKCLANGQKYDAYEFTAFGAFVMQNDLLFNCLTVKETLMFSARMRLSGTEQSKEKKVEKLIKDLQLSACKDTFIGSTLVKGISGGERKRACIGVELVANPIVIILDEPTSGLDSFTAYTTIQILKDLAKREKKCIIFTIHSPSYDIFTLIDRLILLQNGSMVYQGQTSELVPYMRSVGIEVPEFQNICDFFMNQIQQNSLTTQLNSENFEKYLRKQVNSEMHKNAPLNNGFQMRRVKQTFMYQSKVLLVRAYQNYVRDPQLFGSKIYLMVFFTIYNSYLYWGLGKGMPQSPIQVDQVDNTDQYLINIEGIFFAMTESFFFANLGPVLGMFPRERAIFLKEENSKIYNILPYFVTKVLVEFWFVLIQPIFTSVIVLLCLQIPWNLLKYAKLVFISVLMGLCANGLGLTISALFKEPETVGAVSPLLFIPMAIFGGRFANLDSITKAVAWVQYLSPLKYCYEAFLRTLFDGEVIEIQAADGSIVGSIDPLNQLGLSLTFWYCALILFAIGLVFHCLSALLLKLSVKKLSA